MIVTPNLCVLLQISVNVHANMIQPGNGQSQVECAQSKLKGQYTGERIPGAKYRAIVDLAAQGRKIDRIAREAKVTWRTAKAVVERETRQIAQRKQELLDQSLRIARRAANKIEEKLDGAPLNQLIPAFGVAIDKVAALSADPLTQANQQHLHLHLQAVDLIGSFNNYLNALESTPTATKALPSGQDSEATQPTEATGAPAQAAQPPEASDGCAMEEKDRAKRE